MIVATRVVIVVITITHYVQIQFTTVILKLISVIYVSSYDLVIVVVLLDIVS